MSNETTDRLPRVKEEAPKPDRESPEILVIVGSPHVNGKSALFADKLSEYLRLLGCSVSLFEIAKYSVAACNGCGVCSTTGNCCITGDAWNVLARHMETCSALIVIAPVYFAGPSGWLKAMLDRCQMFWVRKHVLKENVPPERPAYLVAIGDGGDPFGTLPLETICTSALNCANLRIMPWRIYRMIGEQYDLSKAVSIAYEIRNDVVEEQR